MKKFMSAIVLSICFTSLSFGYSDDGDEEMGCLRSLQTCYQNAQDDARNGDDGSDDPANAWKNASCGQKVFTVFCLTQTCGCCTMTSVSTLCCIGACGLGIGLTVLGVGIFGAGSVAGVVAGIAG